MKLFVKNGLKPVLLNFMMNSCPCFLYVLALIGAVTPQHVRRGEGIGAGKSGGEEYEWIAGISS